MELICIRKQLLGTLRCQAQSLDRICQVLDRRRLRNVDPDGGTKMEWVYHIQMVKWCKMVQNGSNVSSDQLHVLLVLAKAVHKDPAFSFVVGFQKRRIAVLRLIRSSTDCTIS